MVRTYVKKKTYPEVEEEDMKKAMQLVLEEKLSVRQAAEVCGVKHTTLFYRMKKIKIEPSDLDNPRPTQLKFSVPIKKFASKYSSNQVFSEVEENLLEEYLIKSSSMHYGLTYFHIRTLAYEYATHLGRCPKHWEEKKRAGVEWMKGYMKRHNKLSLRKPENTSLARTVNFNKENVEAFQNNLAQVYEKYKFTPDKIYNLDETGVMTVVQAPKVVAHKGAKQVGQISSGERGSLITMCAIISATGNTVPPVFIFPRARLHDTLMNGSVPGSIGLANSPSSGWMTNELFIDVLNHLIKHTNCTKDSPILLIMDNHETHCHLNAILLARENGIIILTIPPHCSHRLQPLDVCVLGPFKRHLATTQNDWLLSNPGKKIAIHDLPALAAVAYDLSFTRKNIISSFKECGIWPFSRSVFTDEDYIYSGPTTPHSQTDLSSPARPISTAVTAQLPTCSEPFQRNEAGPSCSGDQISPGPELVRPYPQALAVAATNAAKTARKKGKSRIWTSTPEKNRLEEELRKKEQEKLKKEERKKIREIKAKRKLEMTEEKKSKKLKKSRPSQRLKYDDSTDTDTEVKYMEGYDSPFSESEDESIAENEKISILLEKYYAIYYDLNWYLGRVLDFPDEGFTKIKFLKQGLGESYEWPKHDDIQTIQNKFIFYGPLKIIGNGPFLIDERCKRRIIVKYRSIKNKQI